MLVRVHPSSCECQCFTCSPFRPHVLITVPQSPYRKKLWKKHADRPTDPTASTAATATTQPRRASSREKESVDYDEDAPALTAPLVFLQHTDANSGLTAREENTRKCVKWGPVLLQGGAPTQSRGLTALDPKQTPRPPLPSPKWVSGLPPCSPGPTPKAVAAGASPPKALFEQNT